AVLYVSQVFVVCLFPIAVAGYGAWIKLGFLCPMHGVPPNRPCEFVLFDVMLS
ncbi:hypothetical protein GE21DRAFT_1008692, partial [Neurospora crassa]